MRTSPPQHVKVFCRVRPLVPSEISAGGRTCISIPPRECASEVSGKKGDVRVGDRCWPFDGVFGEEDCHEALYDTAVAPLVRSCLAGYNATVLAYGQTGSGKTFTMGVAADVGGRKDRHRVGTAGAGALPARPASATGSYTAAPDPTQGSPPLRRPQTTASSSSMPDSASSAVKASDGVIPRALAALFDAVEVVRRRHDDDAFRNRLRSPKERPGGGGGGKDNRGSVGGWTQQQQQTQTPQKGDDATTPLASNRGVRVRVSYLEIYNEEIRDLLNPASAANAGDQPPPPPSSSSSRAAGLGKVGSGGVSTHAGSTTSTTLTSASAVAAAAAKLISVREDGRGGIEVKGALQVEATSLDHVKALFEKGCANRATAGTLMNAHSSRSHAVFTVYLDQHSPSSSSMHDDGNDDGSGSGDRNGEEEEEEGAASSATQQHQHRLQQQQQQRPPKAPQAASSSSSSSRSLRGSLVRSKFHFVDLAGSERAKRTGVLAGGGGDGGVGQGGSNQGQLLATQGLRLRESKGINQGLLALGKVISALTSLQQRQQREGGGGGEDTARTITAAAAATPHLHVPYRDSKLTRLLQDSLGGNSATAMLACISPADNSVGETVNTLKYASKARQIVNAPVVNVEVVAAPTPPAAASVAASKGRGNDDKDSLDGDTGEDIYQAPLPSSSLPDEEALRKRVATLERLLRQQQLGSKMINNKTSKRRDHERQGRRRRGGGSAANGTREEGSSSKAGGDDDDDDTEELALALLRAEATLVKVRGALAEMASSSAPSSGALQGQQQQQQRQSGALSNAGLRRLLRLLDEHDVEDIGNGLTRAGLLTADPDHKLEPWEAAKFGHADHSRADHSRAGAGISCAGDVCGECGRDADCAAAAAAAAGGGAGGGSGSNKAVLGAWSLAQCCCGLQKALWLARREAAKLRQELGEAKGDLSRDEEIFAEKLKELRDAQDEAILLQERNEFLESNVEALKEKVSTLEKVAPQNQNLKKKKSGNYKKDKQRTTQKNGKGLEKEKKKEKFKKKRNREYEGDLDRNTVNGGGGSCGGAKDEWGAEAVNGGDRTGLVAGAVAEAKQSARGDRGERSSSSISSSSPSLRMKHSCKGEGNGGGGDEKESKGGAEEKDMLAAAATVVVRRKRGQWGNPNTNAPSLASSSAPSLASSAAAPAIPAAAAADGKTRRNHLQPLSSAAATARKQHQRLQGEWQALEAEAGRAQAEARALEVEVRDGLDVVAELERAAVLATAEEEHSQLKGRQAGSKVGQQRAGSPKAATGGDGTRHGGAVDMWSQGDENDDDDGDFEDGGGGGGGGGYTNGGASNNKSSSSSSGSSVSSSRGGSTRGGNRSGSDGGGGGGGGGAAAAVVDYSHVIEAAEKEVEDLCAEATSRGHVLSGLVSSAKEAVELVGKYRDRMSTLQAEVATLRSALLSAADTLLHHSPSDTPRSVVQGTKARKQALQFELDARTKELRALAMQEEEQRRVTALKRQTDDRASEIRRELEAIHGRQRDAQRHLQRLLRQQQQHGGEGSASGGHGFDTDDTADAVGEPTKSSDETAAVAILHKKEDAGGSATNRKREEEVERDATSEQDRRRRRVFESQRLEAEAAVAVLERRWKACVLTAQRLKQEAEQAKQQVVAGEMALRAEEAELEEEVKAERSVEIEAIVAGKKRGWGSDRNCDDNDGGDAGGRNAGDGERIGEEEKRMDSDGWKDGDDDDGSDDESGNESDDESDESTSDNDTDYASDSDDDEDENADEYGDDNYHDECGYGNKDEEEVRGWVMKALEVAVAEVQHTRTQALKQQQQQQPPATTIRIREAKAEVATQLALRSRVVSAQTQVVARDNKDCERYELPHIYYPNTIRL